MDKFMVVLADGGNTFNFEPHNGNVVGSHTAYGASEELLGIPNDPDDILSGNPSSMRTRAVNELNSRIRSVCRMIRDAGIKIYAVTFGSSPGAARGLMENCASQPASNHYLHSSNNAALRAAFKQIGSQLSNLRIAR